jgi:hypothetical protein
MAKKMPENSNRFVREDLIDGVTGDGLTDTQRGSGEYEAIHGQDDVSDSGIDWTSHDDGDISPFFDG